MIKAKREPPIQIDHAQKALLKKKEKTNMNDGV